MTTARRSARHTLRSSNHPMLRNTSEVLIRLTWAALSDAEDLLHLLKKLTEVHRFALAAGCDWKALSTAVVSAVLDYIRGQNPAEIRLVHSVYRAHLIFARVILILPLVGLITEAPVWRLLPLPALRSIDFRLPFNEFCEAWFTALLASFLGSAQPTLTEIIITDSNPTSPAQFESDTIVALDKLLADCSAKLFLRCRLNYVKDGSGQFLLRGSAAAMEREMSRPHEKGRLLLDVFEARAEQTPAFLSWTQFPSPTIHFTCPEPNTVS
ncbi:hypothetical protein B0H13DRAFT_2658987 [Mycena leptocephala]|nr:hypothetical protein B0H13DRAFT_2658987 [Mycena leptocephala]